MNFAAAPQFVFPPVVATHLIKLACELPDRVDLSLSLWDCTALADTLREAGIVESISPQTVQRILASHKLKPWRVHHWLSPKVPRDETFREQVLKICDLYTRPLQAHEMVLSLDEKTSLQPRTRTMPTRAALPGLLPAQLEHEYARKGALQMLAAFDTRSGQVTAVLRPRKRQAEFIQLLEQIDRTTQQSVTLIHLVCDNLRMHKGKKVKAWLQKHPRFVMCFTPVHCSWMNQVEQWFSILQRKRLVAPNFADIDDLQTKLLAFISQWNQTAHPFNWTPRSFDKVLGKIDAALDVAA